MDCKLTQLLLPYLEKHDLADKEAAEVEAHLAGCSSCRATYESDQKLDRAIGDRMQDVPVPADLCEKVGVRLAAEQARVFRAKLVRVSAIAAGLLLAASLGFGWWQSHRHPLDPQRLADQEDIRGAYVRVRSLESAEAYFAGQGLHVQLPADFDYFFLSSLDVVMVEGEKVAQVEFVRGEHRARVQVFPRKRFQLAKNTAASSQCVVEITQNDDFVYVVIFYGDARRHHFQSSSNAIG